MDPDIALFVDSFVRAAWRGRAPLATIPGHGVQADRAAGKPIAGKAAPPHHPASGADRRRGGVPCRGRATGRRAARRRSARDANRRRARRPASGQRTDVLRPPVDRPPSPRLSRPLSGDPAAAGPHRRFRGHDPTAGSTWRFGSRPRPRGAGIASSGGQSPHPLRQPGLSCEGGNTPDDLRSGQPRAGRRAGSVSLAADGGRRWTARAWSRPSPAKLSVNWLLGGAGVALRSLWDVGDALADERLVRVLPDHEGSAAVGIWAFTHRRLLPLRSLRCSTICETPGAVPPG